MIKIKNVISEMFYENCYIIYDDIKLNCIIVDPGKDINKIINEIEKNNIIPEIVINTHGHCDHIFSDNEIRCKFKIPLAVHENEIDILSDPEKNGSSMFCDNKIIIKKPEILLNDCQQIDLSFIKFTVIHTPGHTKGSICLLFDNFLITGDTLFKGSIGRTDLYSGNDNEMNNSIQKLKNFDKKNIIYPGHGEKSILSIELQNNLYLKNK
jgi:glyoxylase-like metal-dependent hydrolase (beta-lactamase superfamily II)